MGFDCRRVCRLEEVENEENGQERKKAGRRAGAQGGKNNEVAAFTDAGAPIFTSEQSG